MKRMWRWLFWSNKNLNTNYRMSATFGSSSKRSYVSILPFCNDFFSYTKATNSQLVTTGRLEVLPGLTPMNCPQGRVLRETGRKLYPDANPGVTTYMVGVYDDQTLQTGFINPNSPVFGLMNTDKPTYLTNGLDIGTFTGTSNVGNGTYSEGSHYAGDLSGAFIGLGNGIYDETQGTLYASMYNNDNAYTAVEVGHNLGGYAGMYSFPNGSAAMYIDASNSQIFVSGDSNATLVVGGPAASISLVTTYDEDAYGAMYTYTSGRDYDYTDVSGAKIGIEAGKSDTQYAGVYSDGTMWATSSATIRGGITVGSALNTSLIANIYAGVTPSFSPPGISGPGENYTEITIYGLTVNSRVIFTTNPVTDNLLIYTYNTVPDTNKCRVYFKHIAPSGTNDTTAHVWAFIAFNVV